MRLADRDHVHEWSGLCPAGRHGLDYRGQVCDLCPSTFAVWPKDGSDTDVRTYAAPDVRIAAELRAHDDARDDVDTGPWPLTYCVRDDRSGTIWCVDVDLVHRPAFVTIAAREVEMTAATHVLWGGRVLCEDRRLAAVPGSWPAAQRWISLKAVSTGTTAPSDRCETCWTKVHGLIAELRQIGADR